MLRNQKHVLRCSLAAAVKQNGYFDRNNVAPAQQLTNAVVQSVLAAFVRFWWNNILHLVHITYTSDVTDIIVDSCMDQNRGSYIMLLCICCCSAAAATTTTTTTTITTTATTTTTSTTTTTTTYSTTTNDYH